MGDQSKDKWDGGNNTGCHEIKGDIVSMKQKWYKYGMSG